MRANGPLANTAWCLFVFNESLTIKIILLTKSQTINPNQLFFLHLKTWCLFVFNESLTIKIILLTKSQTLNPNQPFFFTFENFSLGHPTKIHCPSETCLLCYWNILLWLRLKRILRPKPISKTVSMKNWQMSPGNWWSTTPKGSATNTTRPAR